MALVRSEDWPRLLREAIGAAKTTPFAWGSHDCAMFACGLIQAMTGVDPGAAVRGTYSDLAGSEAVIAAHGGSLEAMARSIAADLEMPEINPNYAQRGDLVLAATTLGPALGIVTGVDAIFAAPAGLVSIPIYGAAIAAWKV